MVRKSVWLLSAGLFALSVPAHAQVADPAEPPEPSDTSATEQAAVEPEAQAAAEANPDEIIITAQGRTQVLQDVPIAVTSVTGNAMENSGATDIRQLNQLAPSLLVSSTGSEANGSARIRGIGTVGDNPGLESSVAVFIDGVYRSRSGIGLNELGEIDRVEVLRGPQGTLFGRNASAGLINILSKRPSQELEGTGELTIGNYDLRRVAGGLTGGLSDTIAARIDAVYVKRDGFYDDPANDTTVNNRNRFFTRGQLLFEPNEDLTIRLIADVTRRKERCCGAIYVDNSVNDDIGNLNEPATPLLQPGAVPARTNDTGNNIVNVLRDLGQDLDALHSGYERTLSVTPGRGYGGRTKDWGLSGQADYDFDFGTLTSITAYRSYDATQGGDLDYSTVDILYRTDDVGRRFKTFSQELRLQGNAFNDRLDWLVGGYFANEKLRLTDDLKFGSQYGRFATCRIVSPGGLSPFYSPTTPTCMSIGGLTVAQRSAAFPLFGPASPLVYTALDNLENLDNLGSTRDTYNQRSRNWALFTHNIFHITPQIDATVGLRYTSERKKFDATFGNNNNICTANQALLANFVNPANPSPPFQTGGLFTVSQAILGLSCQGNSTAELNGVSINDRRKESEFTGTGVLSYKPNDDLLFYGSYSRGYKAGGFNLDRSALKAPALPFSTVPGGAQALVGRLQFDPEIVDAFELGAKYSQRGFIFNVALFRQQFKNFQLNTFDGTVFVVQNVNGCESDLGGADRDQSVNPGSPNFIPPVVAPGAAFNLNPAADTGRCDEDDVGWGVRSQGVELEAMVMPMRDLRLNLGLTYADTKYRKNLVGDDEGTPLSPALRMLPGDNISNAPKTVVTGALAWTPPIGGSGMTGLFYVDARMSGGYNTGSDLFPQKEQDRFTVVNGRIGVRGPDDSWSVELWGQNLFNKDYAQVAFNTPFQAGGSTTPPWAPGFTFAPFVDPQYPGGRQLFSQFLAEPRTYGLTLRAKFGPSRAPAPAYVEPPAPPPPPATQTCPDGSVIDAAAVCPAPPPPPPPPASGQRG